LRLAEHLSRELKNPNVGGITDSTRKASLHVVHSAVGK
jgi:hypothetical protein